MPQDVPPPKNHPQSVPNPEQTPAQPSPPPVELKKPKNDTASHSQQAGRPVVDPTV